MVKGLLRVFLALVGVLLWVLAIVWPRNNYLPEDILISVARV